MPGKDAGIAESSVGRRNLRHFLLSALPESCHCRKSKNQASKKPRRPCRLDALAGLPDIVRLEGLQTEERVKLLMESTLIKLGKKVKRFAKSVLLPAPKPVVSYVRRFERIKTPEKVCAMTFDDGPMDLPCAPDRFGGEALTDVLLDTLAEFGAKGVFDVVGDT